MHRRTLLPWKQLVLLGALTCIGVLNLIMLFLEAVAIWIADGTVLLPSVAIFLTLKILRLANFRELVPLFLGNRSGSIFTLTRPEWRTCLNDLVTMIPIFSSEAFPVV